MRTAQAILDRTGLGPSQRISVNDEAGERLVELMNALAEKEEPKRIQNEWQGPRLAPPDTDEVENEASGT